MVRSVSLYHSDRLKNMPKKNSPSITIGTTLRPEKYLGEMKYLITGRKYITPRKMNSPKITNHFMASR